MHEAHLITIFSFLELSLNGTSNHLNENLDDFKIIQSTAVLDFVFLMSAIKIQNLHRLAIKYSIVSNSKQLEHKRHALYDSDGCKNE